MSEDQRDLNGPADAAKPDEGQQYDGQNDDQNDPQNDQQQTDAQDDDQNNEQAEAVMQPEMSMPTEDQTEAQNTEAPEPTITNEPQAALDQQTASATPTTSSTGKSDPEEQRKAPPPPPPPAEPVEVDPTKGMNHMESFHGMIHPDDAKKLLTKPGKLPVPDLYVFRIRSGV